MKDYRLGNRRQTIDGWYSEGTGYVFIMFASVTRADDDDRCDATNGKRNKQDKTFVTNYLSI